MTKNKSKAEDKDKQSRVDKTHGGNIVESVSLKDLESFNDSACKHENLVRDSDELAHNTFACANLNCNEIFLYDKVEVS